MKLEDLPPYIREHARTERGWGAKVFLVVMLPWGANKTDRDWEEQPAAKKWLKKNGFSWDDGKYAWLKEVPD